MRLGQMAIDLARAARRVRRVDVVYMRWHPLGFPLVFLCRIMRTPTILEVNGTLDDIRLAVPSTSLVMGLLRLLTKAQFLCARHAVVVTPGLATWARSIAANLPLTTIPNGAPLALAKHCRPAVNPPYAVFVGELAEWQGIDTLLEAIKHERWPTGLPLHVVGDGRLANAVQDFAKDWPGHLLAHGRLSSERVYELLSGAILSISPQGASIARNRYGVSPIKVAESIIIGVPVVLSDVNSAAGAVETQRLGRRHVADDPRSIADAVRTVLDTMADPAERRRISSWGVENMTWDAVAQRTAEIVRSVREASDKA